MWKSFPFFLSLFFFFFFFGGGGGWEDGKYLSLDRPLALSDIKIGHLATKEPRRIYMCDHMFGIHTCTSCAMCNLITDQSG